MRNTNLSAKAVFATQLREAREGLKIHFKTRPSRKCSTEKLAQLLSEKTNTTIHRSKIEAWENSESNRSPSIEELHYLCDILSCDIGHLFGEHDCKTKDIQGVHEYTGLNEVAIKLLNEEKKANRQHFSRIDFVNTLFSGTRDKKENFTLNIFSSFTNLVVLSAPCSFAELKDGGDREIESLKHYYTGRIQQAFLQLAQAVLDELDEKEMKEIQIKNREQINYFKSIDKRKQDLKRFRRLKFYGDENNYSELVKEEGENANGNS